jgi:membrane protein insertase Oxa1/YidC/SpoIIIJ
LMLQGLEILFKTNSTLYSWLLWGVSIFLLTGAASILLSYLTADKYNTQKKMAVLV